MMDLLSLKMTDAAWQIFFNRYIAIMHRINQRGMSAEELLQALFDVVFVMKLQKSTQLRESIQTEMRKPKWSHVQDLVPAFSNVLRQVALLEKHNADDSGARAANSAFDMTSNDELKRVARIHGLNPTEVSTMLAKTMKN